MNMPIKLILERGLKSLIIKHLNTNPWWWVRKELILERGLKPFPLSSFLFI